MKSVKYYLRMNSRYLNAHDEFSCPVILGQRKDENNPAFGFASEAAAVAKAETLGLDLGQIRVVRLETDDEGPGGRP